MAHGNSGRKPHNFQDLTGQRFGLLTAISPADASSGKRKWNCVCDCGNSAMVFADNLRRGQCKSCGCQTAEMIVKSCKAHTDKVAEQINLDRIDKGAGEIRLPAGETVFVDAEDIPLLSRYVWCIHGKRRRYARAATGRRTHILMHVLLMGKRDGLEVDHKDNNGLNNRRQNLRWATTKQNMANRPKRSGLSSKFKGVSKRKFGRVGSRPWVAQLHIDGKNSNLGSFATEEEAARAYDTAALKEWGEFAVLNFPQANNENRN